MELSAGDLMAKNNPSLLIVVAGTNSTAALHTLGGPYPEKNTSSQDRSTPEHYQALRVRIIIVSGILVRIETLCVSSSDGMEL